MCPSIMWLSTIYVDTSCCSVGPKTIYSTEWMSDFIRKVRM